MDFSNAKWIAMDPDSTILFPHIHLLNAKSQEARSLKVYAMPTFYKSFNIDGKVRKARAYICGMGQYELFINKDKVGEYFLTPGWTKYDKEMLYNEFDVTDLLRKTAKKHVDIKVMLGGGMYDIPIKGYHKMAGSCGAPKLLFCLHIEYKDGKTRTIVSDESWTAEESPVRYSSIYAGEWHDAGFNGKKEPVVVTKPKWPAASLIKQQAGTFVKVNMELPFQKLSSGLYDMRQNCSGIVRIKVKGEKGRSIVLRPAEILKNGSIYQKCMPQYEWKYTLKGDKGGETWQPQFSYTGFRYVEVEAEEGVELMELTGLHTTTDAPEVGTFECSDTLFNKIHTLIDWAVRSNIVSITTDCPTREKLGWQEQNHLMAYSMMYRYDMHALMNKIADDMAASQHANGAIPTIAPEYTMFEPGSGFEDTPEWGASFILCPWYTYLWYGDDSAIRKHYVRMKKYINYLVGRSENGILSYGLGDWFDMGPNRPGKAQLTSVALSATAMFYYELTVMEKVAFHLGKDVDRRYFSGLADDVKKVFNEKFYTGPDKVYENGSQTGLAMVLYTGLVTDSTRLQTLDALVRDIESRDYALTAGDVGFRYVVQALQQNGRSDVIYKMNVNDKVPGYAYQMKKGATSLTESWQAYDNVSNNHLMLGHLMEWLYSGLGGIMFKEPANDLGKESAWKHIVIAPQMVGDITWAKTSLNTPNGKVSCHWTRNTANTGGKIDVCIPDNSDAEIHLPDGRIVLVKPGSHSFSF
ncbi:family 78 glycoside hydrolase catalytic domain [Xylanibacter muris]|nr:family 78 glycoside hydrolase catalytic domain [Xylanibacter muris]